MKRFKVLTLFFLWGMTYGQPISNKSIEKVPMIKSEEMLQLVRNSMEKSAHTYGMNLSSNLGYIWNNIDSRTPILHSVGNPNQKFDLPQKSNGQTTEKKPPQILEELLNYEEFWKWLSDWTTLYMQALSDYLSKAVRDEVAKEVQMYFSVLETADYLKKLDKINSDRVRDQLYLEVKHKLIEEGLLTENNYKTDLKKEINDVIQHELDMLKKRKDKDEKRPNQIEKHRVEADRIYGNSFGNEKVINIYIFNANKDANEIIDELKPITDGVVNGTYTFGEQESIVINEDKKETEDPISEIDNEDAEIIKAEDK